VSGGENIMVEQKIIDTSIGQKTITTRIRNIIRKPKSLLKSKAENGLHSQEQFREFLIHERKRSERSQRHFFLVILDISELLKKGHQSEDIVSKISAITFEASREIDLKGWYEEPDKIGIIFTEVSVDGLHSIFDKIHAGLLKNLGEDFASRVHIVSRVFPEADGKTWAEKNEDEEILYPDVEMPDKNKKVQLVLKRSLDITASTAAILMLLPVFLIVALMVKITSKGPVLFKQERIGIGGRRFLFYKFRSMHINNDCSAHKEFVKNLIDGQAGHTSESAPIYKIKNDPRVTPIGRFIRKTSLDELPQFFNVLKGDMSLVGPRPPIGYEVEMYNVWHRRRVTEAKPGITGLWQVYGRSLTTFEGMVRMDIAYVRRMSFWLDVQLILKTPAAVVAGKGAL
jgi:lipopolysaccharide/colanic/teichoic acid biosynthesis glycosyltransferase